MKVRLLPSSFDDDGTASARQHLSCLVVNDRLAIDAGSLALGVTDKMRREVRSVVLTHAHLDHIAGLPLFIDDLFASLTSPVRIYALQEVIDVLENDIFNWKVFPRFSELRSSSGVVMEYKPIGMGENFQIDDLILRLFKTEHLVPSAGTVLSDKSTSIAITGDTSTLEGLTETLPSIGDLKAVLVECAFPNELADIARNSHHMTPATLAVELERADLKCPIYVINIKPQYRNEVVSQLAELKMRELNVMSVGEDYFW
jgi:cAMP phosphodiesterase